MQGLCRKPWHESRLRGFDFRRDPSRGRLNLTLSSFGFAASSNVATSSVNCSNRRAKHFSARRVKRVPVMQALPKQKRSLLNEMAQQYQLPAPIFEEISRTGPDHAPLFRYRVIFMGRQVDGTEEKSRSSAEENAAALFYQLECVNGNVPSGISSSGSERMQQYVQSAQQYSTGHTERKKQKTKPKRKATLKKEGILVLVDMDNLPKVSNLPSLRNHSSSLSLSLSMYFFSFTQNTIHTHTHDTHGFLFS